MGPMGIAIALDALLAPKAALLRHLDLRMSFLMLIPQGPY